MVKNILKIDNLDSYYLRSFKKPSKISGVYILYLEGLPVYIGQSKDVYSRVLHHSECKGKIFDRYYFIQCEHKYLDLIESYFIHKFNPSQNKNHNHHGEKCAPYRKEKLALEILLT